MTTLEDSQLQRMVSGIQSTLKRPPDDLRRAEALMPLLSVTAARAVGCWRHVAGELQLAGFLAADDMPAKVQAEFVVATRCVPLSQHQFGIVQAVINNGPALNHRLDTLALPAVGSIGWLGRFEAASSLAIPFFQGSRLAGTLAVATRKKIEENDTVWQLVIQLAERLSAEDG